jgi:hypothetical protein
MKNKKFDKLLRKKTRRTCFQGWKREGSVKYRTYEATAGGYYNVDMVRNGKFREINLSFSEIFMSHFEPDYFGYHDADNKHYLVRERRLRCKKRDYDLGFTPYPGKKFITVYNCSNIEKHYGHLSSLISERSRIARMVAYDLMPKELSIWRTYESIDIQVRSPEPDMPADEIFKIMLDFLLKKNDNLLKLINKQSE